MPLPRPRARWHSGAGFFRSHNCTPTGTSRGRAPRVSGGGFANSGALDPRDRALAGRVGDVRVQSASVPRGSRPLCSRRTSPRPARSFESPHDRNAWRGQWRADPATGRSNRYVRTLRNALGGATTLRPRGSRRTHCHWVGRPGRWCHRSWPKDIRQSVPTPQSWITMPHPINWRGALFGQFTAAQKAACGCGAVPFR
jgi:hypothetical protein